jgi:intracellular septation protein A
VTDAADDQHPADQPTQPTPKPMLVESIGGWRGLVDSALPVIVFVLANAVAGLRAAIWAAIGAGVVLVAIRLARRQTVQQAMSGFFGVLIAAFIANRTGEAKGYFLFGIWASFLYAGVFLVSLLARWPLVGLIWEYVDGRDIGTSWRRDRPLMRVYTACTLLWVVVFLTRGVVQRYLYDQDLTGWLAFARLAMGYPVTIAALAVSVFAVRRVRRTERPDVPAGERMQLSPEA